MDSKYIVGIEIGSSKVKGAVGCIDSNGQLSIQAVEEQPLVDCVRYGVIQNVEIVSKTVNNILNRIQQRMAPRSVKGVYVALGGLSMCTSPIEVQRQLGEEKEINRDLIAALKAEGRNTVIDNRDVVGYAPLIYTIDGKTSEHPEGTYGTNIRLRLNLISCKKRIKCNIDRVLAEKLNIPVFDYMIRPTAEADLVLTSEEKRSGCMFVDFGAETTTVSIYKKGSLQYLATLPLGSRNITKDLTRLVHLEEHAERLKCTQASAKTIITTSHQSVDGVEIKDINSYVSARAGEIIANILEQIKYAHMVPGDLPGGIIVVGGGAKLRDFIARLSADAKMKIPVRVGVIPQGIRITDARIQANDAIDIISVIYAAAMLPDVQECMPEPLPEPEPVPVQEPVQTPVQTAAAEPDPVDVLDEPAPVKPDPDEIIPQHTETRKGPRRPGFFARFGNLITNMMTENDDLDGEDDD